MRTKISFQQLKFVGGPARDESNRPLFYKKDLGILARSGFDFETSKE